MKSARRLRVANPEDIVSVVLSDAELVLAERTARARQVAKETFASTRNYKADKFATSLGVHVIGAKGEVAVARAMGWTIDRQVKSAGDEGCDFKIGYVKIDVQTTTYCPGHLKFDELHPFRSDVAILVEAADDRTMRILGWVGRLEFPQIACERDYGYGPRMTVDPGALRPLSTLSSALARRNSE